MTFSVVVLPLPLGPISPCTCPGRISRSSPSIACTPPKFSATCSSVKAPASGAEPSSGPSRSGRGTIERAPVLEIKDLGYSAGDREHDDEQQYRIEKCRPCDQRRGKFRQHGQENRAEQRSENGATPADQDCDEEQDRQVERERVRRDVGLQRSEQSAGNRGDGAAEQEHFPQKG